MTERSIDSIIDGAFDLWRTAQMGLEDMRKGRERTNSGFYNAVVFGRTCTFALQNLRGKAEGFDDWYDVKQAEMKADPLFPYFKELRNTIEKQASSPLSRGMILNGNLQDMMAAMGTPPPGAVSSFFGDRHGGNGWDVEGPDGETIRYYSSAEIPGLDPFTQLHGAPDVDGVKAGDGAGLVEAYLTRLRALLVEARQKFGSV